MRFKNTEVFNFDGAIHGMRNPLNSWNKSDSHYLMMNQIKDHGAKWIPYHIGNDDLGLAQRLILAGDEHAKFMRQIMISTDIVAPLFWWKEADTYKVSTVANSTSTMHKLASTPITIECFETNDFNEDICQNIIYSMIDFLEELRKKYIETKDIKYWRELIRWLPESWLQTRTWTANYAVLRNIYFQRRDHRLIEWRYFCEWIKSLPYAKELITLEKTT